MKVIKDSECSQDSPIINGYPEKFIYGFGKAIKPAVYRGVPTRAFVCQRAYDSAFRVDHNP